MTTDAASAPPAVEPEHAAFFEASARFALRGVLGHGGSGVVYEVLDRELDEVVALKLLRRLNPQSIYRLKREFRALADLHHPSLIRLHSLFAEDARWFFTMELLRGRDLLGWIRGDADGDGPLSAEEEARLRGAFGQVADGISALHVAGMVHRDIKPGNVVVTPEGRAVLLDLGLVAGHGARAREDTDAGGGSLAYMAPEQASWGPVGPAADWYAFGVMLHAALTGRLPFESTGLALLEDKLAGPRAPPSSLRAGIPADLDGLCVALLQPDAALRARQSEVRTTFGLGSPGPTGVEGAGPCFVGRDDELRALHAALADSRRAPVVVLVDGEPGVGKTALVERFTDDLAADRAGVVLAGRCYERESVPYRALDAVMDALSRVLRAESGLAAGCLDGHAAEVAALCRIFPVLLRCEAVAAAGRVASTALPASPLDVRGLAFGGLRHVLGALAERGPLVLLIDDLHRADVDSITLLADLLGGEDPPRLLVLGAMRDFHRAPEALRAGHDVRRIEVGRLAREDTLELARRLGGPPADIEPLAREAGGHPMFLRELLMYARTGGGGAHLTDALRARIARLEVGARSLLEVACLAGAPLPEGVAFDAAGIGPAEGQRWTAPLRVGGLLRSTGSRHGDAVEPYHDVVSMVVRDSLDGTETADRHRRIADALVRRGEDEPRWLVHHLRAAGDLDRAAGHARRAAELAMRSLAFAEAAEHLELALAASSSTPAEAGELRIELAEALTCTGRGTEAAEHLLQAAAGASDRATRLVCRRRAADQLLKAGHLDEGLRAVGAALAEIGESFPSGRARPFAAIARIRTRRRVRELRWTRRSRQEVSADTLHRIDVFQSAGEGVGLIDPVLGLYFQSRALDHALRAGEPTRLQRALMVEVLFHGAGGAIARAERVLDELRRAGEGSDDPVLPARVRATSGLVRFFAGDFRQAERELRETAEQYALRPVEGEGFDLYALRVFRLLALRHCGELPELRRLFDRERREAARRRDRYTEVTLTRALATVWLYAGDPGRARRELDESEWAPRGGAMHLQHWYERFSRVETALYEGDGRAAQAWLARGDPVARALLLRVGGLRSLERWLRARAALSRGQVRAAGRLGRLLSRERGPFGPLLGQLVLAGVAVRRGDARAAARGFEAAAATADRQGLLLYAAVARRRHGEHLGGDAGRVAVEQAESWMRGMGVAEPPRVARLYAP